MWEPGRECGVWKCVASRETGVHNLLSGKGCYMSRPLTYLQDRNIMMSNRVYLIICKSGIGMCVFKRVKSCIKSQRNESSNIFLFCTVMYIQVERIIEKNKKCRTRPPFCTSVVDWIAADWLQEWGRVYATKIIGPVYITIHRSLPYHQMLWHLIKNYKREKRKKIIYESIRAKPLLFEKVWIFITCQL